MRQALQIHFHGTDSSAAVEDAVRRKLQHLERFSDEIVSCRVGVELLQRHSQQGRPFGISIALTIPGRELVVSAVQHEDVYVAIRDAFDAMGRQLEEAARQRRGEVKRHAQAAGGMAAGPERGEG
jgi:ribosomal subunit interface protein